MGLLLRDVEEMIEVAGLKVGEKARKNSSAYIAVEESDISNVELPHKKGGKFEFREYDVALINTRPYEDEYQAVPQMFGRGTPVRGLYERLKVRRNDDLSFTEEVDLYKGGIPQRKERLKDSLHKMLDFTEIVGICYADAIAPEKERQEKILKTTAGSLVSRLEKYFR